MRKRLLLTLFVSVLVWGGLELAAKWSLGQSDSTDSVAMPYDAYLLWKLGSGTHSFGRLEAQIDGDGFREVPINEDVQDQIVFLGDSSTFGFEVSVEDTFAIVNATRGNGHARSSSSHSGRVARENNSIRHTAFGTSR